MKTKSGEAGEGTWRDTPVVQRGRILVIQPKTRLGCRRTLPAHVRPSMRQHAPVRPHRAALKPFVPACVHTGGCPGPGTWRLALLNLLRLTWPHFCSLSGSLWVDPGPQACRPHHPARCHLPACWGCPRSHCLCIDEDVKRCWSRYGPLRHTACHRSVTVPGSSAAAVGPAMDRSVSSAQHSRAGTEEPLNYSHSPWHWSYCSVEPFVFWVFWSPGHD